MLLYSFHVHLDISVTAHTASPLNPGVLLFFPLLIQSPDTALEAECSAGMTRKTTSLILGQHEDEFWTFLTVIGLEGLSVCVLNSLCLI